MSIKKLFKFSLALMMALSLVACADNKNENVTFNEAGTFDAEETLVSADITADDVILQNKTIEGDLYINVPGNGSVTLSNVTVKGSIYVNKEKAVAYNFIDKVNAAGDEYTINLFDVVCNNIEIENFPTRLVASGSTNINMVKTNSSITLQEQNITKNGFNDVAIQGGSEVNLTILAAGIRQLTIANTAMVTMITDNATLVEMLQADSPVSIYGGATINVLQANSSVMADVEPQSIVVGANGTFNGKKDPEETTTTTPVTTTSKPVTTTKKPTTTTTKKPVTTTTTTKAPVVTIPVTTTTTTKANTAPVITAEDVTLLIDDKFNPLTGVTIYDAEDGYITVTNAHIRTNLVNVSNTGTYNVVYVYTDKGGLTTTHTRKVTVTNQLDAPKNVKAYIDDYGDVTVEWDPVDNANSYTIFIANQEYAHTSRTYYTIPSTEFQIGKSLYIGVSAESRFEDIRPSYNGKYYLSIEDDVYTVPKTVDVGEMMNATFKISSLGVNTTEAYAKVRVHKEGVAIRNTYITSNVQTDKYGVAEFDYDRNKGINFKMYFAEEGEYTFYVEILNREGLIVSKQFTVYARGDKSSSSGSSTTARLIPTIESFTMNSSWNFGTVLEFTLSRDINLNDGDSIRVVYEWASSEYYDTIVKNPNTPDEKVEQIKVGGNQGDIIFGETEVLGGTTARAGEVISLRLSYGSEGTEKLNADYNEGCKIYLVAEVIVTDGYGEEKADRSTRIVFYK